MILRFSSSRRRRKQNLASAIFPRIGIPIRFKAPRRDNSCMTRNEAFAFPTSIRLRNRRVYASTLGCPVPIRWPLNEKKPSRTPAVLFEPMHQTTLDPQVGTNSPHPICQESSTFWTNSGMNGRVWPLFCGRED